jgi:hypothetical protein
VLEYEEKEPNVPASLHHGNGGALI